MNINLSRYNCFLFFLYLFLCAYNFVFYVTYKEDQCIQTVATGRLLSSNNQVFIENIAINSTKNFSEMRFLADNTSVLSNVTQSVENVLSSIQLTSVPLGIAVIYVIISFLSLLAFFAIRWFSHMLPEKFASLGLIKGTVGCFIRNNPKLMRFVHYIIILMILVQFALIFGTDACKYAKHINGQTVIEGLMWEQAIIYNIVTLCFWGAMFCGFPFIKQLLPQEAFIFEPYDPDLSILRYIFCSFLGPN